MKNSAQIQLLEAQIDKIDDLEKGENYDNYKSWHTQTELLLALILILMLSEGLKLILEI